MLLKIWKYVIIAVTLVYEEFSLNVAFISLGCDKNLVDSEAIIGVLEENGAAITPCEEADAVVINTCGFIKDAAQEGVEHILRAAQLKSEGRIKKIIVAGCMARRYKDEIIKEIPEVDTVATEFDGIAEALGFKTTFSEDFYFKRKLSTPPHLAYLKIAEGCDNRCSYCAIPSIKGKFAPRSRKSLIKETELLAELGVKELILVAQDTAAYPELHLALRELSQIDGIKRIRILYCYPENLTDEVINEIAANEKICNYLDIPIQHSEDSILKKMARKTSKAGLTAIIQKLRAKIPGVVLRTTVIVGFPGETEEEFSALCEFIKEIKFDKLGAFEYSKEEGTPAAKFKNQIPAKIKKRRKEIIMETQNYISNEINQKYVGREIEIITDGFLPEENANVGRGYMDCYEIDGMTFFKSDGEIISGELIKVLITAANDYDLIGEII
jgi:ribosomal protein S12 methylthiotransferase